MKQQTIQESVTINGVGLHTGKAVTMTLRPADPNQGIRFRRVDQKEVREVISDVNKVVDTNRGTTLKQGNLEIHTVEHLLSALYGCGIDNVIVELDGPELPILDGSAKPFVDLILEAGYKELDVDREYFEIKEPIRYSDKGTGSEILALPSDRFEVTVMIDFDSEVLGKQYAEYIEGDDYANEIAPCRTFVFLHEIEPLLEEGLIKGGDLDNAIVIVDRLVRDNELNALANRLGKPSVQIEGEGFLNTVHPTFKNEPARHKLLDILGDLALLGRGIRGRIIAKKPGHRVNVAFAKLLKKKYIAQRKLQGIPDYDPSRPPVFDVNEIKEKLPHRFPFLFVDKITELSENHVVGVKNITFNETFFQGHFPGNPVFPGVLQVEAMAQTGGIFVLSTVPDPQNWDTYFLKIDHAKFKQKVVPGDTLLIRMEKRSPLRRGICHMSGKAFVGNRLVSEADLVAQIIKRKDT